MAAEKRVPMLYPYAYAVLWRLALEENDGGEATGYTVHDLFPRHDGAHRRRAGSALRSLEGMGLVTRLGMDGRLVRWITTSTGWETVFRFEVAR